MTTIQPTTPALDIEWMSLRGALRRSSLVGADDARVASRTTHVVDVTEPLGEDLRERLAALPPDDLVVILSTGSRSASPTATEQHFLSVEEAVRDVTSAQWVVLRCSPFAQEFVGSVRNALNESIFAAWHEREVPWLDFDDVVEVIAAIAEDPTRRHKTYEVTGSELSSPQQLANVVAEVCGMPFHYVLLAPEQMMIAIHRAGTSMEQAERRTEYMMMTTGPERLPVTDTVRRATGRDPRSATAVARAHGQDAYAFAQKLYQVPATTGEPPQEQGDAR